MKIRTLFYKHSSRIPIGVSSKSQDSRFQSRKSSHNKSTSLLLSQHQSHCSLSIKVQVISIGSKEGIVYNNQHIKIQLHEVKTYHQQKWHHQAKRQGIKYATSRTMKAKGHRNKGKYNFYGMAKAGLCCFPTRWNIKDTVMFITHYYLK